MKKKKGKTYTSDRRVEHHRCPQSRTDSLAKQQAVIGIHETCNSKATNVESSPNHNQIRMAEVVKDPAKKWAAEQHEENWVQVNKGYSSKIDYLRVSDLGEKISMPLLIRCMPSAGEYDSNFGIFPRS